MTARLLPGLPHAAYHADTIVPGAPPTLSRSCAHTLLSVSARQAWHEHPRLGGGSGKSSKALDAGSLVHALLLGAGQTIHKIGYDDYRTNEAKKVRDWALAAGRLPVLVREHEAAEAAVYDLSERMRQEHGFDLSESGIAGGMEVTALWEEDTFHGWAEGGEVRCRARMDLWSHAEATIRDIKVVTKGPINVASFLRGLQYEATGLQPAVYIRAMEAVYPELAGRIKFEFILCQLDPPHDVAVVPVLGHRLDYGGRLWEKAVGKWAECLATNHWPGAGTVVANEVATWEVERLYPGGEDAESL